MAELPHHLVIEAGQSERQYWRDLFQYRELLMFLAWRDILVRYKQTVIGIAWAVIRPLLTMIIFTIVFGRLARLESGGVPYPILVFSALLPWQFFSSALTESSNTLIGNANLVSKVYFPRMIMPVGAVLVALVDFAISFLLLCGIMVLYGYVPSWRIFTIPLFLCLAIVAALGPGLLVAALNVKYRDFRYVVPFIVQMGLYISPVGFKSSIIADKLGDSVRLLYSLNPMVGVIDGFRWAICGDESVYLPGLLLSICLTLTLLAVGIWYFRRTEKTFADLI